MKQTATATRPGTSRRRKLFGFLPLWGWVVIVALIGGIVGLGTYTFLYAEGASYLSDDPRRA